MLEHWVVFPLSTVKTNRNSADTPFHFQVLFICSWINIPVWQSSKLLSKFWFKSNADAWESFYYFLSEFTVRVIGNCQSIGKWYKVSTFYERLIIHVSRRLLFNKLVKLKKNLFWVCIGSCKQFQYGYSYIPSVGASRSVLSGGSSMA